jgi:hypothetical protein
MFGLDKRKKGEEAGKRLEAFIVQYVHQEIGFIPVHIAAMQTEADFEGAESELPLFVLWGEEPRDDSYAFRTWTNWSKMIEIAEKFDGPQEDLDDPAIVRAALTRAYQALTKVSTAAIYDLFDRSRKAPSRICDEYWFPDQPSD